MSIDWKRKLTSRKFWGAVAGFAAGMYAFFTSPVSSERITGLIMAAGVMCSYIFGEGWSDVAHAGFIEIPEDMLAEDDEGEDADGMGL